MIDEQMMGEWMPETGKDIVRDETVGGYRICQFVGGGVRVTKDTYWSWSYPGDFEREKAIAERCALQQAGEVG